MSDNELELKKLQKMRNDLFEEWEEAKKNYRYTGSSIFRKEYEELQEQLVELDDMIHDYKKLVEK